MLGVAVYGAPICVAINGNAVVIIFGRLPLYAVRKTGLGGVCACLNGGLVVVTGADEIIQHDFAGTEGKEKTCGYQQMCKFVFHCYKIALVLRLPGRYV